MKKKTELDDIDVVFDSTPLTDAEKEMLSEFIRNEKAKGGRIQVTRIRNSKGRTKIKAHNARIN